MAVQLNMSSYRADHFVGDANLSQRLEAQQMSRENSQFAQMLGSHSSANAGAVNSSGSVQTETAGGVTDPAGSVSDEALAPLDAVIRDTVKFSEMTGKETASLEAVVIEEGAELPEDVMDLARAIVNGDIDIKDVPADKITFELLKALLIARFEKKLEDEEKAEDPKEKAKDQTNVSPAVDAQLAILYKLIDAYTAMRDDGNTDPSGITKRIREVSEMLDQQGRSAKLTDILAQILNDRIEAASVEKNEDVFLRSDEIVRDAETKSPMDDFLKELGKELGEDNAKALEEALKSGDIGEITKVVKQIAETAVKSETSGTAVRASVQNAVSEELEMLRSAKQAHTQRSGDSFMEPAAEQDGETVKVAVEAQGTQNGANKSDTGAGSQQGAGLAAAEAPVIFRADNGAEIEVQPSEVVSQAMKLVEQAIRDTNEQTEYSLILNPGELGRITVRMVKAADGAVSVTIAAENARTQRILEENSSLMQSNLRSNGIQLESWQTVGESQQETLAQDYNGSSKNPYYREDAQPEEEPEESFADIIAAM